ncbi:MULTISPECIES: DUF4411 family protein [Olsenella]|uniref:DUF4411 family protein n=1 Tax=Olsenella TaxID=133925 RepID=UPI00071CD9CD|nr:MULTISPECIES: DUF4411 family protein [Olsenella]OFK22242.1 hypothetical protein HMPREF2826_02205 [Olsenella sp. HMSC062G07]
MERYLLDANIFITSEHHIPQDIFESFWLELGNTLESGVAVLHQTVVDELKRKKDPLVDWIGSLDGVEAMPASDKTLEKYLEVCAWADGQSYEPRALREFKDETRADAWLCAEALASNLTLVTYETPSNSLKRVKIPNVCEGLGARHVDGFDFMRAQGFRF